MKRSSILLRIALLTFLVPMVSIAQGAPAKALAHTYRLTYTLTVTDAGKKSGVQHFGMTISPSVNAVPSSSRGTVKLGDKVPVVTGSYSSDGKSGVQTQFTYLDVGMNIAATITDDASGVQLNSKIEQSSVAPGPPGFPSDPIVRQIVLENTSMLVAGKPIVLGSLDVPDTMRHLDIEVVMERLP
jgi:hypothetical protein